MSITRILVAAMTLAMAVPAAPALAAPIYSLELFEGNAVLLGLDRRIGSDGTYLDHYVVGSYLQAHIVIPT